MFSTPDYDQENIFREGLATTPRRKPLKLIQEESLSGTPVTKKKARPRSCHRSNISRHGLARQLQRKSLPFALSKPFYIFKDDSKKQLPNCNFTDSILSEVVNDDLNKMIQNKVSETIRKIRKKYEEEIEEKQQDIEVKTKTIACLLSENEKLKSYCNHVGTMEHVVDKDEGNIISTFVQEIISNSIDEIKDELDDPDQKFPLCDGLASILEEEKGSSQSQETQTKSTNKNVITCKYVDVSTFTTPKQCTSREKCTSVTPIQRRDISIETSPLVAALQPEIITSLPFHQLRTELESAAISNELLRAECFHLNTKVDGLQATLTNVSEKSKFECSTLQEKINNLETRLDDALEKNHQLEMTKPLNVEEYDATIATLQKEILLKEKQMLFYIKKASETENLQQDLRRMYSKYNTEHQHYVAMQEEITGLSEKYSVKCNDYKSLQDELSCVKAALSDAIYNLAEQDKVREEATKYEIKCVKLQEQIEIFQNQQTENLEFLEQERKGLEESSREWELMVIKVKEELCESRLSLEEERQRNDELNNMSHQLRTQVSDLQDELNAVKSQSYLVMLEQEKELEAVSRVLQETWEQLMKLASDCSEKTRKFERKTMHSVNEEKKSLVCSVLTAVSTNISKSQDTKKDSTSESNNVYINDVGVSTAVMKDDVNEFNESEDEFTLVKRVKEVQRLLLQFHKDSQTIIQRQVDEISVLQESLRKNDAETKKLKRDLENTKEESENLKFQLTNAIKDVNEFRDRTDVLDEKCRAMMGMESENKSLKNKLHLLKQDMTNIQQDKICAEKELQNLGIRLEELKEVFETKDDIQQISLLNVTFTELLEKKLKLEKKVDKLCRTKAKVLQENESLMQCNARLENKIRFIHGALIKAENEICRLDDIVDKFCQATKASIQSGSISLDLMELLKVLNIVID